MSQHSIMHALDPHYLAKSYLSLSYRFSVQSSAKRWTPGLVNFVPAVAYHFCLALPEAFTQPGTRLLADPCTTPPSSRPRPVPLSPSPPSYNFTCTHAICSLCYHASAAPPASAAWPATCCNAMLRENKPDRRVSLWLALPPWADARVAYIRHGLREHECDIYPLSLCVKIGAHSVSVQGCTKRWTPGSVNMR